MPRYIKKTLALLKPEATYGVDSVPTGAANAVKAFDMSITPLEMSPIQINAMASYFGAAVFLPGAAFSKCTFSVLLAGAGAAATSPAWGAAVVACAMSEGSGLVSPARVEYLPVSDLMKSASLYWYDDGLLHKLLGAMGTVTLSAKAGDVAKLTFSFTGLETTPTPAVNVAGVLTAWKDPVALKMGNVTDITLGCTYAAGVLTGGTAYNSSGLTLDWSNSVEFVPLLTTEEVVFSDRKIKGSMSVQMSPAQEAAIIADIKARTTRGLGFVIGTNSGNKIMLHAPAMVPKAHKKEEFKGMRLVGVDFELDPVLGNDELRIVSL